MFELVKSVKVLEWSFPSRQVTARPLQWPPPTTACHQDTPPLPGAYHVAALQRGAVARPLRRHHSQHPQHVPPPSAAPQPLKPALALGVGRRHGPPDGEAERHAAAHPARHLRRARRMCRRRWRSSACADLPACAGAEVVVAAACGAECLRGTRRYCRFLSGILSDFAHRASAGSFAPEQSSSFVRKELKGEINVLPARPHVRAPGRCGTSAEPPCSRNQINRKRLRFLRTKLHNDHMHTNAMV